MTNFIFIITGIGRQVSGGDVTTIEIARRIISLNHHVTIVTSLLGKRSCEAVGLKADYWVFDNSENEPGTLLGSVFYLLRRTYKATIFLFHKYVREPTIVFPSSDMLNDIFAATFLRGIHIRRFAILHMIIPSPFRGYLGAFSDIRPKWGLDIRCAFNWVQQRLSLLIMKMKYEIVIPHSPYNRIFLSKMLSSKQIAPFELIPGVDWQSISLLKSNIKIYDACWIGRFHTQKGCEDLIRTWKIVCEKDSSFKLAIIGNVQEYLMPLVKKLNLEQNIVFEGYKTGIDKFRIISQSKLFVFPSYFEGRPAAISEAIACGIPVVAYDLPVYRDCYSGMVVVQVGKIQELANKIVYLLTQHNQYEKLVEALHDSISIDNWNVSVQKIIRLAETILTTS